MRDLPRGTQVADHGDRSLSPTGLSPAMARLSRQLRLAIDLVTPPGPCRAPMIDSYNPNSETAATYLAELVWALPVSLATTQGISYLIYIPAVTEMFQFTAYASVDYLTHLQITGRYSCGVTPFGNARVNACEAAHRALSWPSTSFIASMSQGIHLVP